MLVDALSMPLLSHFCENQAELAGSVDKKGHSQQVAERPKPRNLTGADWRKHRVMPKVFAPVDVGQVHLNNRRSDGFDSIPERH